MTLPEFSKVTPQTLKDLQLLLGLSNDEISALVGVSTKTWLNRISAKEDTNIKLLSKLEYAYLKDLAMATSKKRTTG